MQSKRHRSKRLLEDALGALARALNESGAPWMVIGGIAIIASGVRRFTTDVDAVVRGDAVNPRRLVDVCARHRIVPRVADAVSFAQANLVLLMRHEPTGVDLDVSFAWSEFEHDALAACTLKRFGAIRVPLCTPEHLVVFKAIAGRPRDLQDAEALLALYPGIDASQVRSRVAELATLAEAPELLDGFDAVVKVVRSPLLITARAGTTKSRTMKSRGTHPRTKESRATRSPRASARTKKSRTKKSRTKKSRTKKSRSS